MIGWLLRFLRLQTEVPSQVTVDKRVAEARQRIERERWMYQKRLADKKPR